MGENKLMVEREILLENAREEQRGFQEVPTEEEN